MTQVPGDLPDTRKTELQKWATDVDRPAIDRYREMVIGQPGFGALVRFELTLLVAAEVPGALGHVLRKALYPGLMGSTGGGAVFGRSMTLRHAHKIHMGAGCVFDDLAVLDAKGVGNQGIRLGDSVMVGRHSVLGCKGGDIEIGDRTNVGINCIIHSESSLRIGSNVLIASFCYVLAGGRHGTDRVDIPIIQQPSVSRGVEIGDNCWLGAHVTVNDGVTVGHDSIIGTGAVVLDDIPPFSIAAGVPARVIRSRLADEETPA